MSPPTEGTLIVACLADSRGFFSPCPQGLWVDLGAQQSFLVLVTAKSTPPLPAALEAGGESANHSTALPPSLPLTVQ